MRAVRTTVIIFFLFVVAANKLVVCIYSIADEKVPLPLKNQKTIKSGNIENCCLNCQGWTHIR